MGVPHFSRVLCARKPALSLSKGGIFDASLNQFPRSKVANQRQVGLKKVEFRKILRVSPPNVFEDPILQLSLVLPHYKEPQLYHAAIGILVLNPHHLVADGRMDSKLFFQFAAQGIARLLSFLNFSTRKFPLERHGLVPRTLTH